MSVERALEKCSLILGNIFKFLSARDLNSCSQVCSFWHNVAECEKKKRPNDVSLFLKIGAHDDNNSTPFLTSDRFEGIYYNEMESELCKELQGIRNKPVFCITFISSQLYENFRMYFPNFTTYEPIPKKFKPGGDSTKRKYLKSVIETALKPHLPTKCPVVFCVSSGVVGWFKNITPVEIEDTPAITSALFPKQPGVDIQHFAIQNINSNLSDFIKEDSDTKCVLIFFTSRGSSHTKNFIKSCRAVEEKKVAVGGAIVEHTESLLGSIVAFSGPNVDAASVIIKEANMLTTQLELFKNSGLLDRRCFAFMFVCVGKGYYHYRNYNVESTAFHKMYPNVPLFGVFGNGEIGVNYIPNTEDESPKVPKRGRFANSGPKYLYSYSTVFVLIGIKD